MDNNINTGLDQTIVNSIKESISKAVDVTDIILFGSRAKGNYTIGSDIDIALKGKDLNAINIIDLLVYLDNLDLPYKFDLVIYDRIENQKLKDHIDRVGIAID